MLVTITSHISDSKQMLMYLIKWKLLQNSFSSDFCNTTIICIIFISLQFTQIMIVFFFIKISHSLVISAAKMLYIFTSLNFKKILNNIYWCLSHFRKNIPVRERGRKGSEGKRMFIRERLITAVPTLGFTIHIHI